LEPKVLKSGNILTTVYAKITDCLKSGRAFGNHQVISKSNIAVPGINKTHVTFKC
jgi:hypothetical protein